MTKNEINEIYKKYYYEPMFRQDQSRRYESKRTTELEVQEIYTEEGFEKILTDIKRMFGV